MDLKSGRPFWAVRSGLIQSYPKLESSTQADVVVLGAGITGALIADRLAQAGLQVVVLDRRDVGTGSTSASTALLQYEIDTHLTELIGRYGTELGVLAYRACLEAIGTVEQIDKSLGSPGQFQLRPSFYFAKQASELPELVAEYECRLQHDFPVSYWDQSHLEQRFDFSAYGGIYSSVAGQVDPYRLAHALLRRVTEAGGAIFDRTEVVDIEGEPGSFSLKIENGLALQAKTVVVAMGYESLQFCPQPVAKLQSTYAFVSQPLEDFPGWHERCLIWEMARPYLYLRTTDDNRLLAGGGDLPFRNATARDVLLEQKTEETAERVREMFPRIPFQVDFSWAGTFAETEDGLPFIGVHPDRPGVQFAMCYGGNGITYSVIAAEMIASAVNGRAHPLQKLFGFERLLQQQKPSTIGKMLAGLNHLRAVF